MGKSEEKEKTKAEEETVKPKEDVPEAKPEIILDKKIEYWNEQQLKHKTGNPEYLEVMLNGDPKQIITLRRDDGGDWFVQKSSEEARKNNKLMDAEILERVPERYKIKHDKLYKNHFDGKINSVILEKSLTDSLTPISHKKFDPQLEGDKRFSRFEFGISDGKLWKKNRDTNIWSPLNTDDGDQFSFVITMSGELRIGHGHYYLSESASQVLAAGSIFVNGGKITLLTNGSGHYLPSEESFNNTKEIFKNLGIIKEPLKTYIIKPKKQ